MDEMYKQVGEWIWSENFWLPSNYSWEKIYAFGDAHPDLHIPRPHELFITIPYAFVIVFIRFLFERLCAYPVGRAVGIKNVTPRKAEPNPILEKAFKANSKILKPHVADGLAHQLDWSVRQVERWWRRRRSQGKPTEMKRFAEACWRCLFYFLAFYYGLWTLWDKPWLWDLSYIWIDYPYQPIAKDVYWYYMIELSFYISLVMSILKDNKRKDFFEHVIHHFTTISLIVISWGLTYTRLGTMLMVVHDSTDYLMEGAKIAKYLKFQKLCDALFVCFTITWFVARIVYFPFWVIRSCLMGHYYLDVDFWDVGGIYIVGNGLILVLAVLNFFWFSIIVKMVYFYVVKGVVEKDDRSETDTDGERSDTDVNLNDKDMADIASDNNHTPLDNHNNTQTTTTHHRNHVTNNHANTTTH